MFCAVYARKSSDASEISYMLMRPLPSRSSFHNMKQSAWTLMKVFSSGNGINITK